MNVFMEDQMRKITDRIGSWIRQNREMASFICVMVVACILRLFFIGNIPGNRALFVDEMFSGYESWSMLKYGYEIDGYRFPVYLTAWGSGMSAMQALTQLPFIAVLGLNSVSVRLPAAILGCITVYAFYYICRQIRNSEFALFAAFILAVMPWHIMQSRYALDCYYFVGVITITIALLLKGQKDSRFIPVGFLFMGLTLYTYVLPWVVMPVFALGCFIFLLRKKEPVSRKTFIISAAVLVIMAIPLLLFVMINNGMMNEIRTPVFSIPRLRVFRSDEVALSPGSFIHNLYDSVLCLIRQNDGSIMGCTESFGLYYKFSIPFIAIGMAESFINFFSDKDKNSTRKNEFYILLLFVCAVIVTGLVEIDMSFYRINIIQIPMTFFLVNGLWTLIQALKNNFKQIAVFVYAISCVFFILYYFTDYDAAAAENLMDGGEAALSYVKESVESGELPEDYRVNVVSGMSYVTILFYEQYPTDKYMQEIVYRDDGGARLIATEMGRYRFFYDAEPLPEDPGAGDVYICSHNDHVTIEYMEKNGMETHYFSTVVVGIHK